MSFSLPHKKRVVASVEDAEEPSTETKKGIEIETEKGKEVCRPTQIHPQSEESTASEAPVLDYTAPLWAGFSSRSWYFEVLKSGVIIDRIFLPKDKTFIVCGRLPSCDLSMEHASISRLHAVLQFREGSNHGTFVNKNRIPPKKHVALEHGSLVRFGESSRLYILQTDEVGIAFEEDEEQSLDKKETETAKGTFENPVKTLREWFEEHGERLVFHKSKVDGAEDEVSLKIIIPAGFVNLEEDVILYESGPTRREAEMKVCLLACQKLLHMGELTNMENLGGWEEWKRRKQENEEEEQDSFYDRTAKRPHLKQEPKSEISLLDDKRDLEGSLDTIMTRLGILRHKDSKPSDDVEDELDLYIIGLEEEQRSEEIKFLEVEKAKLLEELGKINDLLEIVKSVT